MFELKEADQLDINCMNAQMIGIMNERTQEMEPGVRLGCRRKLERFPTKRKAKDERRKEQTLKTQNFPFSK